MDLTVAQRRIMEHGGGPLRVRGVPGSGKTTALVARYLALVEGGERPSSVLVVCRDRTAATRFRDAVLPRLAGGFDALPFTTWFGLAFDLVTRKRGPVRLLSTPEQRGVVRRLLGEESPADWPQFGHYLAREAFAGEVAAALLDMSPGTWPELERFAERYTAVLQGRGEVDRSMLLAAATELAEPERYAHVLVDDHDGDCPLLHPYQDAVAVSATPLPFPAPEIELTESFRHPAEPVLVRCPHPSTEAEAVAGELLAARADGVAWSEMAVLVRSSHRRGRAVARSLGRHGIPVHPRPGLGADVGDPAVAAIVDLLRWSAGDGEARLRLLASPLAVDVLDDLRDEVVARAATATPAELAFTIWERGLGHLVDGAGAGAGASLDAVVAFLDGLERRADRDRAERLAGLLAGLDHGQVEPDPWRTWNAAADGDAVTVAPIGATTGQEWHTVVVAGCVDGELPRIRGRASLFDATPASPADRRRASLEKERALFDAACARATQRLVATAAPEPGVLLSPFVEGWATREPRPPIFRGDAPRTRPFTDNEVAVFPDGNLRLSASQLDTYDDCPLRYAYQYGLRVRDDAGAPAALGSLVHEVLAEFLRPDRPGDRTKEALLALAAEHWRDDIARYRPQVEECRRDYYAMLEGWWEAEGVGAPDVLETEHEFDIHVGDLRLVGAIDRVDRTAGGDGIRIVDYKTGRKEPSAADLPDDLQLAVYHLAATRDPELAALGPPRQLQLLYLRSMSTYEQPVPAGHAEATEARILAVAADIRSERFEPSVDASCRTCSFHRLCPLQREGREVGAS